MVQETIVVSRREKARETGRRRGEGLKVKG